MSNVVSSFCRNAAAVAGRRGVLRHSVPNTIYPRPTIPVSIHFVYHNTRCISSDTSSGLRQNSVKIEQNSSAARHDETVGPDVVTPPPKESLSIVFTDIVKSTAMWEQKTKSMTKAMQIHDDIIRDLTQAHAGYEVKQNGDGFMIAFQTAASALQFCLTVQQKLLEQEWPEDILRLQAGQEVNDNEGDVLFRGLRLRMSAHWGEPVCTWNDVIKRMDYLGPMVNRAARFVQVTEGGQIVVSEEFLMELQRANGGTTTHQSNEKQGNTPPFDLKGLKCSASQKALADQNFEVRLLGDREFKGLDEPQKLYFITPQSLEGRIQFWPEGQHVPGSKGNIVAG